MAIHKLSPRFVETVKIKGMYADGGNLYLQVGPEGRAKSWIFRYHVAGRGDRQMGLGPLHTVGLAEARELARQARHLRLNGGDPVDARNAVRLEALLEKSKDKTFRQCAEEWMASIFPILTPIVVERRTDRLVRLIYPTLGDIPIQKFEMNRSNSAIELVHKTLQPIWTKMPPTADEVRNNIECILNWCIAKRYITGDNAASMKGPLGILLQDISKFHEVEHNTALPYRQIGAFVADLRAVVHHKGQKRLAVISKESLRARNAYVPKLRPRPIMTYALEFLILTAVRKGQVLNMQWQNVDWEDKVWVCTEHKTRKKVKQDYLVPLSDAATAILEEMWDQQKADGVETKYVFTAGRHGQRINASSLNMLLFRGIGGRVWKDAAGEDITIHGFRTTFGDWSVDHGYEERDSEMALGHMIGTGVRNVYKRHAARIEPRRLMMQAWASYCNQAAPLPAEVVPFRTAK